MSTNLAFHPIIGLNSQILEQEPMAGCMWFALDTKRIYYSDGKSFLSMGGNTGIYYGNMTLEEEPDSDRVDFDFSVMDIDGNQSILDGNYKIPNKDDLILNIPDGCFYRVNDIISINNTYIIKTEKLTIAGSGNNNGPTGGASTNLAISDPEQNGFKRYFTTDSVSAVLKMIVTPNVVLEGNGINKIEYRIGALDNIVDEEFKPFGEIELDISKYLSKMSTSTTTLVSGSVYDMYGAKKSFTFYVQALELSIKSGKTESIITSKEQTFSYACTPSGGSNVLENRQVLIQFFDENSNKVDGDIIAPVNIANTELPIDVTIPTIGVFTMTIQYRGYLKDEERWISSNIETHKVVYYDENPQLIVSLPTQRLEQYSTLNITYMIAAVTTDVSKINVRLLKGSEEVQAIVDYNNINKWDVYFDTPGFYDLTIEALGLVKTFYNIEVTPYAGEIPSIFTPGLTLNLSAINRSNNEVNKDTWTSGEYYCEFNNFSWGDINGWRKDEDGIDMLRLSSGATLKVANFRPFDNNTMETGQTIELDFKFSGVTDFSQPLIHCLSYAEDNTIQAGFHVTGQESTLNTNTIKATGGVIQEDNSESAQIYNTAIQGLTAKYVENKRIHLTWVIERNSLDYPMIKTYINGIRCGITQYDKTDVMEDYDSITNLKSKAYITLDSNAGIIDIYNIRVYKNSALSSNTVLDNFIATSGSIEDRAEKYADNKPVLNNLNKISVEEIENAAINNNYKLRLPYIKIIGGSGLLKDDEGYTLNNSDSEQRLPTAKKDYRLIKEYMFIDPNNKHPEQILSSTFKSDGYLNGLAMYGQGTSSMEYPVKNLRIKAKMKDSEGNKIKFKVNDCFVDLICLKADYMESSGSHNTGTGNLVYNLTKNLQLKTPGQAYWTSDKIGYEAVSAIRGFPVLIFFKEENADENTPYEFIGKYNFNLDKATHEPFAFMHDENGTFGWDPDGYKPVDIKNEKAFNGYPFDLYKLNDDNETYNKVESYDPTISQYYSIKNKIHCYEFLNNADNLDNFLNDEGMTFEETFNKIVLNDGKEVPNWYTCYESRYPEFEDYQSTDIQSWYELCEWVNSTKDDLDKFKAEFTQHFDFNFTCFYYILTHVLLMIDSRAKNMMIATWDDQHWFPIFYDMDTMLGLNNYGYNKFNYDVEDTVANIYNGQASVLWNNFRNAFPNEIQDYYQQMQTAGLTANNLITNYNSNQADSANENIYNADSTYKYERTFSESYVDGDGEIVLPGTKDYLYASQGSRSMHREWWINNRINYFNGKYLSNAYKSDKYVMRLYTPQNGESYYVPQYDLTKEEFDANIFEGIIYYININGEWQEANTNFDENNTYYIYQSSTEKLDASLIAVPPNNDFVLTPLYNQYLAVAFGGDNGDTVSSDRYAMANIQMKIAAPTGTKYNDTETYVYGGSLIKDLGDLSTQYLGQFHFPNSQTKLEYLTLGNRHKDYYNPNFSSLRIGNSAPYLKKLEITNCYGLKGRSQDVSGCQNLQYLYATGTGLNGITLPSNGVLTELRLPETIKSLTLINQKKLTKDNFTIGTWDYDNKIYTDINKIGPVNGIQTGKINRLQIEDTDIDSYSIVKNNPLQRFYLKNVNWIINDIEDIDAENGIVKVLETLLYLNPINNDMTLGQALTGTITFSKNLNLTEEQALKIYNHYAIEDATRPLRFFPNVNFIFEGLTIYNVNILDGNGNLHWTKKIIGNTEITQTFLSNGPKGKFTIPKMADTGSHTYTFTGKWYIDTVDGELKDGSTETEINGWPIFENFSINTDITLIPKFITKFRQYNITFTDGTDNFYFSEKYDYGTLLKDIIPEAIPYKDDSSLTDNKTYAFIGYNSNNFADSGINFGNTDIVTQNKIYYAIFKEVSVYDDLNIHEDYFNFEDITENGVIVGKTISAKPGKNLKGKITLPNSVNNLPILEIGDFTTNLEISHIFIKSDSSIRKINNNAFYINARGAVQLKYFDFVPSLREIGRYAFTKVPLQPDVTGSYVFNEGLEQIGAYAFNQALDINQPTTIILPSSLKILETFAFSNLKNAAYSQSIVKVLIGNKNIYSKLNLSHTLADANENYYWIFSGNDGSKFEIQFYTEIYTEDTLNDILSSYGTLTLIKSAEDWLGKGKSDANITVEITTRGGIIDNG